MNHIHCLGLFGIFVSVSMMGPAPKLPEVDSPPAAGPRSHSTRIKHTYSIVARDPATGEFGVAVQTHVPFVGVGVPWAEAGVGAVATQSVTDPNYGKLGLEIMRAGKSASAALKSLLAGDDERENRQVAMIDAQGRVAAHTGTKCIEAAGHRTGKDYSVQANLMANDRIWPAMAKAFESAKGDLADRMLAALDAAQKEGGDLRGMQSAALIVLTGKATGDLDKDKPFDIRVDESTEPLKELRRLLTVRRAGNYADAGWEAGEKNDLDGLNRGFNMAAKLLPDDPEIAFWHGVFLVKLDRVEDSLPHFRRAFAHGKNWRELLPRCVKAGILPDNKTALKKILELP
jgi:uncharacterized Ntn-hydrolase superfamily protein